MTFVVAIAVPVIAGLFALLGAFAGSRLAQRAEHQRWLREKRSLAFSEFLKTLSDAQQIASQALNDASLETLQRNVRLTEAYLPLETHSHIVSLFLPTEKRSSFRGYVREIWALHGQTSLGDSRYFKMAERQNDIQRLFEQLI